MSSSAEVEVAALFINARAILPLQVTCKELGHPQPSIPLRTDNSTASGIINGTFAQDRSKAMDMRFYWIVDRVKQGQFKVYWERGITNLADYFTKKHPASHHKKVRPIYTYNQHSPSSLQGCIKLLAARAPQFKQLIRLANAQA